MAVLDDDDGHPQRSSSATKDPSRGRLGLVLGRREPEVPSAPLSPVWEASSGTWAGHATAGASGKRDQTLRRCLALADVAAAYLAVLFVLSVLAGAVTLRPTAILIAPCVVLFGKLLGLYDRDQYLLRKGNVDEFPRTFMLAVLCALTVWLVEEYVFRGWLTRPQVFLLVLSSFVLTSGFRLFARKAVIARSSPERCLVLGDAAEAERIRHKLGEPGASNAVVLGRVGPDDEVVRDAVSSLPRVGTLETLPWVAAEMQVERVIIAPAGGNSDEVLSVIRVVKALGLKVSILPRLFEVVGSSATYDDVNGTLFLGLRPYGLSKSSGLIKRGTDLVGAGIALVLLSPLFLLLTLAIKLDSRGPVFFRQRRTGQRGECFEMLKFRSMVPEAEQLKAELRYLNEAEGGLFKITSDPRITRVGRLIRRTSLDELPQLLNVLRGDMSLVGPRPLVPNEDALIEGWKRRRLAVKPGMTGLWQIFGSSRIPMHEMVKIDYHYGANWSLWLDLKILLRTVPYVLRRGGI